MTGEHFIRPSELANTTRQNQLSHQIKAPEHEKFLLRRSVSMASSIPDLYIEDLTLEDAVQAPSSLPRAASKSELAPNAGILTSLEEKRLHSITLGPNRTFYPLEWTKQSFLFSKNVPYGLVQNRGGPCGLLAAVQAHILKLVLYGSTILNSAAISAGLEHALSKGNCYESLFLSLAEILWRAGSHTHATIVLMKGKSLAQQEFRDLEALLGFLRESPQIFTSFKGQGALHLLWSVVMTRGIDNLLEDMDSPCPLIAQYGYCSQEMVNLLLMGEARSNVFDGTIALSSTTDQDDPASEMELHGISTECEIGLLSLFEHYGCLKVGSNLKNPNHPIWLICSESHYSVLFALSELKETQSFDLYYYDGLAQQNKEIRLTVKRNSKGSEGLGERNKTNSPLELCIRTKWTSALVNWNDSEPLL